MPKRRAITAEAPRRNFDTPRNPATTYPPRGYGDSRGGGNRPPTGRGESVQRPNFNETVRRMRRGVRVNTRGRTAEIPQDERRFRQLPPQQQQEVSRESRKSGKR